MTDDKVMAWLKDKIVKYLTDNLIDIKDVKMGDSAVEYQISEAQRQIDSKTKGRITKDEIVHWNTANNIKRRNKI